MKGGGSEAKKKTKKKNEPMSFPVQKLAMASYKEGQHPALSSQTGC